MVALHYFRVHKDLQFRVCPFRLFPTPSCQLALQQFLFVSVSHQTRLSEDSDFRNFPSIVNKVHEYKGNRMLFSRRVCFVMIIYLVLLLACSVRRKACAKGVHTGDLRGSGIQKKFRHSARCGKASPGLVFPRA